MLGHKFEFGDGIDRDIVRAGEYYQLACDSGMHGACNNLGTILYRNKLNKDDAARALQIFDKTCRSGSDAGCNN